MLVDTNSKTFPTKYKLNDTHYSQGWNACLDAVMQQKEAPKRIEIKIGNGISLVAEQNTDPMFSKELFVGLVNDEGAWIQDLVIVKQKYNISKNNGVEFEDGKYEVFVYADENNEDYTNCFDIEEAKYSSI